VFFNKLRLRHAVHELIGKQPVPIDTIRVAAVSLTDLWLIRT